MSSHIAFIKMNGLGNDFVIMDQRSLGFSVSLLDIPLICNRYLGIGCDQMVWMEESKQADVKIRFFNRDGSESGSCGNATRCVAALMMQEINTDQVRVETNNGVLDCGVNKNGDIAVQMGQVKTDWQDIPLIHKEDTFFIPIPLHGLDRGVALNMGNPHIVFFTDVLDSMDMSKIGPDVETYELFPERINVNMVQVLSKHHIKLVVWERGAGLTNACGSGSCASAYAAFKKGFVEPLVRVSLPGGDIHIEIGPGENITMSGAVGINFAGVIEKEYCCGAQ